MNTWSTQDSVGLSAILVARDGHRLPLRGTERKAAMRLMVELGVEQHVIAHRLCLSLETLRQAAKRYGITLTPMRVADWAAGVAYASRRPEYQREAMRRRRAARRERERVAA